ncbi:MAG: hypothetical protein IPF77_17775 [Gemmatimonadetes bacterium]|nr:hypothetical protein [Gemmatimonadota bacterium]
MRESDRHRVTVSVRQASTVFVVSSAAYWAAICARTIGMRLRTTARPEGPVLAGLR